MQDLVKEVMVTDLYCANPGTRLSVLAQELVRRKFSGAPVVDTNYNLMGIVSLSDIAGKIAGVSPLRPELSDLFTTIWGRKESLKNVHESGADPAVSEFMNTSVMTVAPDTELRQAADMVLESRVHRLVVTEGSRVVGLLTTVDILAALVKNTE
jgi:predicted transcriptional regulator